MVRWRSGVVTVAPWAVATAVLATAFVIRLRDLGEYGLTGDESVYAGQAQALGGSTLWPAVRAHPPLLAALLALVPGSGSDDLSARRVVTVVGVLGVALAMLAGWRLMGTWGGLLAGVLVGLCPYHIDVTRQVLVDVPMATAFAGVLVGVIEWVTTSRSRWLLLAGFSAGLCVLSKETGLVAIAGLVVAAMVHRELRPSRRQLLAALSVAALVAGSYPLWLLREGSGPSGGGVAWSYTVWQFQRPANEDWFYHVQTTLPRMGPLVAFGVIGAVVAIRRADVVLSALAWTVLTVLTFSTLWPTKGYGHLLAVVIPLALLACSGVKETLVRLRRPSSTVRRGRVAVGAALGTSMALGLASVLVSPAAATTGVPAVREAARWLADAPAGCVVVGDVGVSNIVTYYSSSRPAALGLTSDIGMRNPAYRSDPQVQCVRYVVWDVWTERESHDTALQLIRLAHDKNARVAHVETLPASAGGLTPAVIIFEVPA